MTRREFLTACGFMAGATVLGSGAVAVATPDAAKNPQFAPYPSLSYLPFMHQDAWTQFPLIDTDHGPATLIREVCSKNELIVPVLHDVFDSQLKGKLSGDPPPLLGDFIMNHFSACFAAIHRHLPGNYSSEDRVRTAADLTVFALAGVSFPYFTSEQVATTFSVQLPKVITDNVPQSFLKGDAFINFTAPQLPHIYPVRAEQCDSELDRVLRCYGQIDRNSHFAFHLVIAYWFLKSLAAGNPNIARMPNGLSWATKLGSTPSQKAAILEYVVGRGWETRETGIALVDIFTALSLMDADQKSFNWESFKESKASFLRNLRAFDKTGLFDQFVGNDYAANHLGMTVALLFSQARTLDDVEKIRHMANSSFINSSRTSLTATPIR